VLPGTLGHHALTATLLALCLLVAARRALLARLIVLTLLLEAAFVALFVVATILLAAVAVSVLLPLLFLAFLFGHGVPQVRAGSASLRT
jgi:hypothetical protein